MRLTDIMSGANLTVFPQVGLVIFLVVFASVVVRVYGRNRRADDGRWAALPLDDSTAMPPGARP